MPKVNEESATGNRQLQTGIQWPGRVFLKQSTGWAYGYRHICKFCIKPRTEVS